MKAAYIRPDGAARKYRLWRPSHARAGRRPGAGARRRGVGQSDRHVHSLRSGRHAADLSVYRWLRSRRNGGKGRTRDEAFPPGRPGVGIEPGHARPARNFCPVRRGRRVLALSAAVGRERGSSGRHGAGRPDGPFGSGSRCSAAVGRDALRQRGLGRGRFDGGADGQGHRWCAWSRPPAARKGWPYAGNWGPIWRSITSRRTWPGESRSLLPRE